jgi:hypothetical protein
MEKKPLLNGFLPILGLFIAISMGLQFAKDWLLSKGADPMVLMGGNVLLVAVTGVSFLLYRKGMQHATTQGFLRNVYSGMMLKLFACIIAAFIYIYMASPNVNKSGLFGCMGLYLLYTFLEMRAVMALNRQQQNG